MVLSLISCSNIPEEAPQLSVELSKNIKELEKSHLNLLKKYFNLRRDLVDEFLYEEWLPEFAENYFSNPQLEKVWNQVVKSNDKEKRMEYILTLAPELQKKINEKRNSMIKPLDELEETLEEKIKDSYDTAKATNNSITSFLVSAYKVDQNRKTYLSKVGIDDSDINSILDKVDEVADKLNSSGAKNSAKADEFIEEIEKIKKEMN
jgi:CRISPR/Cas system CSM-associated protein Csm2 small subunit